MTVGNYCDSVPRKIEIEIHKQKIKRVTDYKYLGIIFDFNMKCITGRFFPSWEKRKITEVIFGGIYKLDK